MIKNHQDIKDYILQIEARFPVDRWQANGIDLWPQIRIKIYYQLIQLLGESISSTTKTSSASVTPKFAKIKNFINNFTYYSNFQFKLSKKKLLFLGLQSHKILNDGVWFNRFFDSMIDHHNISKDVYTFELNKIFKPSYNQQNTFDVNLLLKYHTNMIKLKQKFLPSTTTNFDSNFDQLSEFNHSLKQEEWYSDYLDFSESSLKAWSRKIQLWESFFLKVYNKVNPHAIIFLSYYGFDAMAAAMSSANKLNIKTVDLQHGPQTNIHMAYCSWFKTPIEGFNTMPKEYWNWDRLSKLNIERWWNKKDGVKVIGHPWLSYSMNKLESRKFRSDSVLYTLQIFDSTNLSYFFPENILDCLRLSQFIWRLRVHPRNENNIEILIDFLETNKVRASKYIIESSKNVSLFESLSDCNLHITNYSGCFIEADMLGVSSVIIDEIGFEMFKDYFTKENNHYFNKNEFNFNNSINHLINNSTVKTPSFMKEIWNPLN